MKDDGSDGRAGRRLSDERGARARVAWSDVDANQIVERAAGAADAPLTERVEAYETALTALEELLAKAGPG